MVTTTFETSLAQGGEPEKSLEDQVSELCAYRVRICKEGCNIRRHAAEVEFVSGIYLFGVMKITDRFGWTTPNDDAKPDSDDYVPSPGPLWSAVFKNIGNKISILNIDSEHKACLSECEEICE